MSAAVVRDLPPFSFVDKKKTHIIFGYKGKNLEATKNFPAKIDRLTHLYTLVVKPDNTFEYFIDGESQEKGSLYDFWAFVPPREIPDPEAKKPEDWVDEAKIADPEDKKPEDWDNEPAEIPDPEAKKPDDWDDEDDGEWEAPMIPNPAYKGEWTPRMIDNPAYKGEWKAPMIPNPEYVNDETVYHVCKNCRYVGFELWQVKSGSIFDNILVADSLEDAQAVWPAFQENAKKEKEMYDHIQEEAKKEAEAAAAAASEEDEEEENEEEL